ncbi:hypothetical protein T492DRAFT_1135778 [Pavlovales sp. CCMP2436]|nr:hypothetical protein T492DRAFT_1135778 [Pavlovales sp. CCMP2436]
MRIIEHTQEFKIGGTLQLMAFDDLFTGFGHIAQVWLAAEKRRGQGQREEVIGAGWARLPMRQHGTRQLLKAASCSLSFCLVDNINLFLQRDKLSLLTTLISLYYAFRAREKKASAKGRETRAAAPAPPSAPVVVVGGGFRKKRMQCHGGARAVPCSRVYLQTLLIKGGGIGGGKEGGGGLARHSKEKTAGSHTSISLVHLQTLFWDYQKIFGGIQAKVFEGISSEQLDKPGTVIAQRLQNAGFDGPPEDEAHWRYLLARRVHPSE